MNSNILNMAINRLAIGDGSVFGFMNFLNGFHITGGIKRYTLERNYFADNISNNFSGGMSGRYGYGNSDLSEAKEKLYGTDSVVLNGDSLVNGSIEQDRVGDYYSTNYFPKNNQFSFYTIDDFTTLGGLLRDKNVGLNAGQYIFENRYSRIPESVEKFHAGSENLETEVGDETVNTYNSSIYRDLFGGREDLSTKYSIAGELPSAGDTVMVMQSTKTDEEMMKYEDYYDGDNGILAKSVQVYRGDNITRARGGKKTYSDGVFGDEGNGLNHNIEEIGKKIRDRYATLRSTEPYRGLDVKDRYYNSRLVNAIKESYGDKVSLIDEIGVLNTGTIRNKLEGLKSFYNPLFVEYVTPKKSYGVGFRNILSNYYSIDEKNKYPAKDNKIEPSAKAGSLRTNTGGDLHAANFLYFEENDGNGPVTMSTPETVSQGFNPSVSNFNNASSLLRKTNDLFRSGEINSLVNRFHSRSVDDDDFLISSYSDVGLSRGRNLKRAGASDKNTGFDNPYCRVWTAHHQYATLKDRIRPFMDGDSFMDIATTQRAYGDLRPNNGAQRLNDNSVLQSNGFVKITPHTRNGKLVTDKNALKRYMFSIENLAWKDSDMTVLSREQCGPFGGRIMWFPPYNLKFNENVNTSWKDNDFIGRGEKIYTYVNTDRKGTLSFSLLIDHPAIIDKWAGSTAATEESEQALLRYFAGCGDLDIADTEEHKKENRAEESIEPDITPKLDPVEQYITKTYVIFYSNNFSAKAFKNNMEKAVEELDKYEMTTGGGTSYSGMDISYRNQKLAPDNYNNESKFALNTRDGFKNYIALVRSMLALPEEDFPELKSYTEMKSDLINGFKDGKVFGMDARQFEVTSIEAMGFASSHGYKRYNDVLEKDRADMIGRLAKHFCPKIADIETSIVRTMEVPVNEPGTKKDVNDIKAKIGRSAVVTVKAKIVTDAAMATQTSATTHTSTLGQETWEENDDPSWDYSISQIMSEQEELNASIVTAEGPKRSEKEATITKYADDDYYSYGNEYHYFQEIASSKNSMVYKNIVEKIKFFDPAFHSITPEGFNARLNFLHQCTRQGPTRGTHSGGENSNGSNLNGMAGNLSFGRAPYCILRIGDFFFSKICIDSLSIDYDNGGGVQWDLNPEGAGVQPMVANVNISFTFIGGQDIEGPVAQLQNAISFNYYANSSIYTPNTQKAIEEYDYNK